MAFGFGMGFRFGARQGGGVLHTVALSGLEALGEELTLTPSPAGEYEYAWFRAITFDGEVVTSGGNPTGVAIEGETGATYTIASADDGEIIYGTATIDGRTAYSNVTGVIDITAVTASLLTSGLGLTITGTPTYPDATYGDWSGRALVVPTGATVYRAISTPSTIDFEMIIAIPATGAGNLIFFTLSNNTFSEWFSVYLNSSGNLVVQDIAGSVSKTFNAALAPGAGNTIRVQVQKTTVFRARINGGAWVDGVFQAHSASINKINIGSAHNGSTPAQSQLKALRDNGQNLLPSPYGYNLDAFDA